MAAEVRITCDGCPRDDMHFVGSGSINREYFICICQICGHIDTQRGHNFNVQLHPRKFHCPKCRKPVEMLVSEAPKLDVYEAFDLGTCPDCAGRLLGELTGGEKN